jgi:RNA polymerase sigma factor (sigma-70 family)
LQADLKTLFQVGVMASLSDGQLLQRLLTERGSASEAAFETLAQRHGPMVLRVCRDVLGDLHDAEDAFQATFLVLARKAASVRKADSVASWLHGVALRVAVRAKTDAARRHRYERRAATMRTDLFSSGENRPEDWTALHEEIQRLPVGYREPLVLCYFEGLTTESAAARLCRPHGTILSRLSRARDRLRARLTRRGVAPTADAVAIGLAGRRAALGLPDALLSVTTRNATAVMAGRAVTGSLPAVMLAKVVVRGMLMAKLKPFVGTLLILGSGVAGTAVTAHQLAGPQPKPRAAAPTAQAAEATPPKDRAKPPDTPERLRAQLEIRKAELRRAEAERDVAKSTIAINKRLNDRIKGSVSQEEINKADAELAAAEANCDVKRAEVRELEQLLGERVTRSPSAGPSGGVQATQPNQLGHMGWMPGGAQRPGILTIESERIIAVPSPSKDKIWAQSIDGGVWKAYQVPAGVKTTPILSKALLLLMMEGPTVNQVAAFEAQSGEWFIQELKEPAKGKVWPIVSPDLAAVTVGRFVYAFSAPAGRWDVLELAEGAKVPFPIVGMNYIKVEDGMNLHIFSSRTGRWSSLDTKGDGR